MDGIPRAIPLEPQSPSAVPGPSAPPPNSSTVSSIPPLGAFPAVPVAQPTPMTAVAHGNAVPASAQNKKSEDSPPEPLSEVVVRNAPPWLVSAAVHMMLMIILGLCFFSVHLPRDVISLKAFDDEIYAEELGEQLQYDTSRGMKNVFEVEEPVLTPDHLPPVVDPFAAPSKLLDIRPDGTTATSDIDAKQIGLALSGRREGSKKSLLGRHGGTKLTEEAVQHGLAWLARNQLKDGSWSLCGPYRDGAIVSFENPEAATAMALLAFQGNGQTTKQGEYQKNIARAWKWLLKQQDADGNFFHEGPSNHRYYTHALCSIAVCELLGMIKDGKYRQPAARAIDHLLQSQSPEGGWRYQPQQDSDVSVTGWCVMALQSARMAGLDVPDDSLRRVERFLDRVAGYDGSRYPYQRGLSNTPAMTAEALLIRQYLGWRRDDPRMIAGMEWITSPGNLVDYEHRRDVYYWYYATQTAHHMEGEYWKRWNDVMRQAVPEQQVTSGKESGSWNPLQPTMDQWGKDAGRLYVTCLSIYMLEVYYRHLPLYQKVYNLNPPNLQFSQPSKTDNEE